MSTYLKVTPLLTQDALLSGAVTVDSQGDTSLRITSIGSWTPTQATQVTNAAITTSSSSQLIQGSLGTVNASPVANTIQARLKSVQDATGKTSDLATDNTIIGLLKRIVANLS